MRTTNYHDLPTWARTTADTLGSLGVEDWVFDDHYPLDSIGERLQARWNKHLAPRARVVAYKAAMERGEQFPPMVVTDDNALLSGNTRDRAATELGMVTFPAFKIGLKYHNTSPAVVRVLRKVAVRFNTEHGQSLTSAEIREQLEEIVTDGDDATQLAAEMNVSAHTIRSILRYKHARSRAEAHGLKVDELPKTALSAFGGGKLELMDDQPWLTALQLAIDANLKGHEITALATELTDRTTNGDRMELLETEKTLYADRITNGKSSPQAATIRRSGGAIVKARTRAADYVETGTAASTHLEFLLDLRDTVTALITEQRRVVEDKVSHRGE